MSDVLYGHPQVHHQQEDHSRLGSGASCPGLTGSEETLPMILPLWFCPTFHGDVTLTASGEHSCVLTAEALSAAERAALEALTKVALKKGWIRAGKSLATLSKTDLAAPVDRVAKALARALKPGRNLVTAVRFRDGRMEELSEARYKDEAARFAPAADKKAPQEKPAKQETALAKAAKPEPPVAAVTVAAPLRGCPMPVALLCEIRATRVLNAFLTRDQQEDYARHGRFLSVGRDLGHRYMISGRNAHDFERFGGQLYDTDERRAYCVHDNIVPPAEEALALHVMLNVPGGESYMRELVHDE